MIQIEDSWVHAKDVKAIGIKIQSPSTENKWEILVTISARSNDYVKTISNLTKSIAESKAALIAEAVTAELIKLKPNIIMQTTE